MTPKKVATVIILAVLVIAIAMGVFVYNQQKGPDLASSEITNPIERMEILGQQIKKLHSDKKQEIKVLQIGAGYYTYGDYYERKYSLQVYNARVTMGEVLTNLKKDQVLLDEAARRNMAPSVSDVNKFIAEKRKYQEQSGSGEGFAAYLKGLGMTPDEYWGSTWVYKIYKKQLTMDMTSTEVIKGVPDDKKNEEYNKYLEKGMKGLEVKMVREDLIR